MAFRWNLVSSSIALILLIGGTLDTVEGYHVVTSQGSVTWPTARDYCQNTYGSTLATITSNADAAELSSLIQASSSGNFWNGLNDLNSEGVWEWQSGHDCGGNCNSLSWWNNNEPNDSGNNEDCGHMWVSGSSVKMNDHQCTGLKLPFICDEAAPTTTDPTMDPTAGPTLDPTADPTADPTMEPTEFHCATHGCDELTVCDEVTGECIRDCDVLHIDEFLTDCSLEWDSRATTINTLSSDIATNTEGIASNDADIATNAANIAAVVGTASSNDADIATLETRMNSVESKLVDIQLALDKMGVFAAEAAVGNVEGLRATDSVQNVAWTLNGKDVIVAMMAAINIVLITAMAVMCCRKQGGIPKYEVVSICSD